MVNSEYEEAFVSGAMLNIEDTQIMREDTGSISPELGVCVPAKRQMLVSQYLDVVDNEAFHAEESIPADAHRSAAWWYCCIPMSVIRRVGLPLYEEAFVSGAMLNIEDTQLMREDTGYISPELGVCVPAKRQMLVSQYLDVVDNEAFNEEESIPADAHRYAAWWYCCIPMSVIRRVGLPLPVFVRYDDVEYGIRSHPKFMTMNGICVWHAKFEIRYNAGVERYQSTRNGMIAQMTTGLAPDFHTFLKGLHRQIDLEMRKFNYTDAELALDGFEDFLKGPKFIEQPVAQERFMRANRLKEQTVPFDELKKQADEQGLADFDPDRLTRQTVETDRPRSLQERAFDFVTHNGQRFVRDGQDGQGGAADYAIITHDGWAYPSGSIHGKNTIVSIDWASRKGVIRHKDVKRYREIVKRYKRDVAYFKKNCSRLEREYQEAAPTLESVDFWKRYLGMA